MTEKERRVTAIDGVCGRIKAGWDPLRLNDRTSGNACKGLVDEIKALDITRDEQIAVICIARASVFYVKKDHSLGVCDMRPGLATLYGMWDETEDIIDGSMILIIDVVEDLGDSEFDDPRFIHNLVNCMNGKMYVRRMNYKYWWLATNGNVICNI